MSVDCSHDGLKSPEVTEDLNVLSVGYQATSVRLIKELEDEPGLRYTGMTIKN